MSFIDWPGELRVGISEIDEDHKELVECLNDLHEVLSSGANGRDGADLLLRFIRHVTEHFKREEVLMAAHGYPATAEHAKEHGELMTVLSFLLDAIRTGQTALDGSALEYIRRWFCGHVENSDAAIARFVLRDQSLKTCRLG